MKKFINVDLLTLGVGIFGSTFLASQLSDLVDNSPVEIVNEYAREIVGAGMLLAGSVLMRQKGQVKAVGTALGGTGAATIAAGLARRFGGVQNVYLSAPAQAQAANGGGIVPKLAPSLNIGSSPWVSDKSDALAALQELRADRFDMKSGNYYLV